MTALPLVIALAISASADKEPKSDASLAETRVLVHRYGACVLRKQQKRASAAIRANVDNGELMRKYPQLIDGTCMPRGLNETVRVSFPGDYFRYALADALVAKEFGTLPAPDFEAVPILDHRSPVAPSRTDAKGRPLRERAFNEAMTDYQRSQAFHYLSRYGECVVRADPAAARALLLTSPESAPERAQLKTMTHALGSCVAEGQTVALNKMSLRGTIAINYYRLATYAPDATGKVASR